jgi:hypothetical protein
MGSQSVTVALGAVSGMAGGTLGGWLVRSHRPDVARLTPPNETFEGEPEETDDWIDVAASRWSGSNGISEASRIVARRVRLAMALQSRRRRRS